MPGEHPPTRFDERAAVEELERLQAALEESRRRRKDASAAFDTFVSGFRKDPARDPAPPPPAVPARPSARYLDALPPQLQVGPTRRPLPKAGVVAGAVVAVAAGVLLTRAWRGAPAQTTDAPAAVSTPASGDPLAASAGDATAASAAGQNAAAGLQAELVAIRRVWVRATVDGVRTVERELRADERVPLRAARTLAIRAGDAGAVRMTIDGQDRGPLGADGIVVTRTYTAPPSVRR